MKCDPCVATAPSVQDLAQAGVWWINRDWNDYSDVDEEDEYATDVHFTRLHIRYNRKSFPQDLSFQVTPNKENFQARYVITHPAQGDMNCAAGKQYLKTLKERRRDELEMLSYLTGKTYSDWDIIAFNEEKFLPDNASYATLAKEISNSARNTQPLIMAGLAMIGLITLVRSGRRPN